MSNTGYINLLKHLSYVFVMLALYVLQTVPGLFAVYGVKPILVIPAAIALAMLEGEFRGGFYGAAAGLLCDMGSFLLFGFNGFLTCFYCIAAGLLVIYLVRCNVLGCLLLTGAFMLARGSLEFLFGYGMWGYEGVWKIYVFYTLPSALYSTAVSPLIFILMKKLFIRFDSMLSGD